MSEETVKQEIADGVDIDGEKVTKERFRELLVNPSIRLKKLSENCYHVLHKMQG